MSEETNAGMLQWGHDISVMEMPVQSTKFTQEYELQWGHDISVMEIAKEIAVNRLVDGASMGP